MMFQHQTNYRFLIALKWKYWKSVLESLRSIIIRDSAQRIRLRQTITVSMFFQQLLSSRDQYYVCCEIVNLEDSHPEYVFYDSWFNQ